jgi:uncharacterized protein
MDYISIVDFEWDKHKSDRCFAERGFDFAYAIWAFLDPERDVFVDERWEYGESRYILRGTIDGRLFVLVFTRRAERIRIISARKANTREVEDHEKGTYKG